MIYIGAIIAAFINFPFALILIALPAFMYFIPERELEKLESDLTILLTS